jgi:ribose 5-phosphate isomerase B
MRIAIAADHNGVMFKAQLVGWLQDRGHEVTDIGTHDADAVVDYPPLCVDLCRRVVDGSVERAILIGGSGLGETIACNKIRGIRAGLCPDEFHAQISRGNNDSNVLVIGAKVLTPAQAERVVTTWLETPFKGGVHQRRIDQIAALERGELHGERAPGDPTTEGTL